MFELRNLPRTNRSRSESRLDLRVEDLKRATAEFEKIRKLRKREQDEKDEERDFEMIIV